MKNRKINGVNVLAAMTAEQYAWCGFKLGDEYDVPTRGKFILKQASGNLTKGQCMKEVVRWSGTGFTTTGSDADNSAGLGAQITVTDAGATVAAGALAGLRLTVMDVGATPDLNVGSIIKGNTAGASGSAMTIYLRDALAAEVTTGISLYVWDPNYVVATAAAAECCKGVAPITIAYATAPYFWAQVGGDAPVIVHDGATSTIGAGVALSTTAGAVEVAVDNMAKIFLVGYVVQPATVGEGLGLIKLNDLR